MRCWCCVLAPGLVSLGTQSGGAPASQSAAPLLCLSSSNPELLVSPSKTARGCVLLCLHTYYAVPFPCQPFTLYLPALPLLSFKTPSRSSWVAQSVKHLTLAVSSLSAQCQVIPVREIEPHIGLSAEHGACLGFCLSLFLCPSPACTLCLKLSK